MLKRPGKVARVWGCGGGKQLACRHSSRSPSFSAARLFCRASYSEMSSSVRLSAAELGRAARRCASAKTCCSRSRRAASRSGSLASLSCNAAKDSEAARKRGASGRRAERVARAGVGTRGAGHARQENPHLKPLRLRLALAQLLRLDRHLLLELLRCQLGRLDGLGRVPNLFGPVGPGAVQLRLQRGQVALVLRRHLARRVVDPDRS